MSKNSVTLFDNLITMEELLTGLLRGQYAKRTIYRWVSEEGMPHKVIRRRLWFPKLEVITWLERTSLSHGNS